MGNCLVKEDKIGMEAVIRTEGLTKLYKMPLEGPPVLALNDLTLEVYPGEVFAMVGPNGSGKTTTLKLLMGLIWPTSGQAWLLGQSPRHVKIKQRIGFLPDGPYFYGHLNAYELLDFYAGLFGMSAAERQKRIPELIELVGLGERGKQRIRTYSKGMVQRIGLAQALLNDPELIFLDEPTSGLDPLGSRDIRDLILEMRNRGKTVFICSHFLAELETFCDRVAILHRGRLLKVGRVQELLVDPSRMEVRASGVPPEALQKLQSLGALTSENGQITIEVADGSPVQDVLQLLHSSGAHLDSVQQKRHTLEQVFIEAVRGEETE
jgi:ABC-2 type transport system ATP-binding protein